MCCIEVMGNGGEYELLLLLGGVVFFVLCVFEGFLNVGVVVCVI